MATAQDKTDSVDPKQEDIQPTNSEKDVQETHSDKAKPEHVDEEPMDTDVVESQPMSEQVESQTQTASEPVDPQPVSDGLTEPQKTGEDIDTHPVGSEAQPASDGLAQPQEPGEEDIVSNPVGSEAQPVSDGLAQPQEPGLKDTYSHPDGSDHIVDAEVANSQPKSEQVDSQPHTVREQVDSQSLNDGLANPQPLGEEDLHSHSVSSEHGDPQPVEAQPMDKEQANIEPNHDDIGEPEQVVTEPMDAEAPDSQPMGPEEIQSQSHTASDPVDLQPTDGGIAHPQPLGEEDIYPAHPVSSEQVDSQCNMSGRPVSSEHEHPHHVNSEPVHEHSQPISGEIVHSQPEDTQPMDTEHANAKQNHSDMVKPEQVERESMDTEAAANSQPMDEQIHSQSQTLSEPVDSQPMDAGLAHPQLLGEEDIYSHPMDGQVDPQSHNVGGPIDSHPISHDGLAHPQPLGEEDVYSHQMSSELVHSQVVSGEMVHLQPVTAELVYTHSVNSEVVHSQAVSSELMHFSHINLEPVNLQPVGMELVNSHHVGNEPVHAQEPLSTEHPNSQQNTPETQPNKRRKKKSIVWEHFTIETVGAGCRRACCKVCKQSFAYSTGSKVAGTSHLKRHIAKGTCPVILRQQEKNQLTPYLPKNEGGADTTGSNPPKRRYRTSSAPYLIFDQDRCRHEIARMIIMHDYPLHMVEHPGFVSFIQNLQPRFDMVSFNIVQGDCVATFLREKQNLQRFIEGIPGRVSLTLDMWTSSYSTGYVFVTGQFIDNDWKLHKRLLNVVMEPFPESDRALSHAVGTCLSDWGLDRKLASITFNQPLSEPGLESLRALLAVKNPLLLNGQLLIRNCIARTLSGMAQDVLAAGQETIKKIRASVKYVKTSESHEEKFLELKQQLQVPTEKSLSLDNTTKWNTTYEMLLAASEMKEVFSCLDTSDPEYKDAPSMEDWKQVENICLYLKLLYDTANMLTVKSPQSTNVFFHEVWKIQLELARAAASDDPFVSGLASPLQEKFHKYWKNSCLILAIAVAMDPRFKMKLVEFSFTKIFGEEAPIYIRVVDDGIHELFHEYMNLPLPLPSAYTEDGSSGNNVKGEDQQLLTSNGLSDFDMYIMETTSQQMKSELDQYLEESLLPRIQDFDVLGWWKLNKIKYPTLSKMARDILSIPISTVSHDSVFDTMGKEMDSYRCSLRPETVEALICAKDWLQQESSKSVKEPVKMEQL